MRIPRMAKIVTTGILALVFITHTDYANAETAPQVRFNPDAQIDTSQVDDLRVDRKLGQVTSCTTDLDCVRKNPTVIPDENTIHAYLMVYGDDVQFPRMGDCSRVDWLNQDEDGRLFVPKDLNGDGVIDCNSDLELGA